MELLNIDMRTILIVLVLGHLFTGMLVISYNVQHKKDKSVNIFLLSKIFQSIAWLMLGLRNIIPDIFSISIGNSLLFIGASLEVIALLIIKDYYNKAARNTYIFLITFSILAFSFITMFYNFESIRVAAASLITVILMSFPTYKLLIDKNKSTLQRVIANFYSIIIVSLLFRAYASIMSNYSMKLLVSSTPNTLSFLLLYLVMLVGSTGFVLMSKEKLDYEINRAASFDELTNIFNRRTFILQAKEIISLFTRRSEKLSFLLIDIDDFKKINDIYGHFTGDTVLKDFAATIKTQLRDYDLFGRYGGEEFAILLPDTNENTSLEIAERLRKAIENSSNSTDIKIKYTVSIGVVSIIPDKETGVDMLYKLSDNALYKAKAQGKNCVVMHNIE